MKKILLTGGGTAGHVMPHLALIPLLRERGYELCYMGSKNGMERELMEQKEGLLYYAVSTGKLRRYFSLENFKDVFRVIRGFFEALSLMRQIKPDAVFSKGGYVAVPVVAAAWLCHVPVVCHESDYTPGLANRLSLRFSQKIATTFPECAKTLGEKAVFTGTPLRPSLFSGSREKGLSLCGFSGQKPILLMMGGSQGAQSLNRALRAILPELTAHMDVLHLCGKGNLAQELQGFQGYCQLEFLAEDLSDALACADFVLSRSGANAICEFQALHLPMLLIPLPTSASRGDQILNAEDFRKRGFALVLRQEEMSDESLLKALMELQKKAPELRQALLDAPPADGTEKVFSLIEAALNHA